MSVFDDTSHDKETAATCLEGRLAVAVLAWAPNHGQLAYLDKRPAHTKASPDADSCKFLLNQLPPRPLVHSLYMGLGPSPFVARLLGSALSTPGFPFQIDPQHYQSHIAETPTRHRSLS